MSFKIKDKTIFITVRSIIVLIMIITLCVLVLWSNETSYNKLFESVLLIAVGYIFGRGETDKNE
jgi:hypothetical protein